MEKTRKRLAITLKSFIVFKACFAGLLAIAVTPLVSLISLFEVDFIKTPIK